MNIRTILLVLALLGFLSASVAGYLFYASLVEDGFKTAEREVALEAERIKNGFSAFLSQNLRDVKALAGLGEIRRALVTGDTVALEQANLSLDYFREALEVDVCYLMDLDGDTVASSNRNDPDSFIGENFSFRPYWKEAVEGTPVTYMALGVTSGRRGVFYSHPVRDEDGLINGVAVIKASIEGIEKRFKQAFEGIAMLADPRGIIFISNRPEWLFHSLWKLTPDSISEIAASMQFGPGPWEWVGMEFLEGNRVVDGQGREHLIYQMKIDNFPQWNVIYLRSVESIAAQYSGPLVRASGPIVLALCLMVGFSVLFLYRRASTDIVRRREAEEALRMSEERYRLLYKSTPAMLHSVDRGGKLLSVSDHWLEHLGYEREEVIGRDYPDFMTEDSRSRAVKFLAEFFEKGSCRDVPYQFVRKDGTIIDVVLSAIVQRGETDQPKRSLAFLVDVTERNWAERELTRAQEELRRYSADLEHQVRERTEEIANILRYTPAVVYIKDTEGCYKLINSRFEELFKVAGSEVIGKTDYDFFPQDTAKLFRENDRKVLEHARPIQVEEHVPQEDGVHTYISVKFPLYEQDGSVMGVGGISTDITELKRIQDQLRRLSDGVMENQEKERAALSRELHDELGQTLSALNLDAVWLWENLAEFKPDASARAEKMSYLIESAIEEVRSMATRLRPQILDDLGLIDALDWFTRDFEQRTGITCVLTVSDAPTFSDTLATAAYRITQEALTNVLRHARASRTEITLRVDNGNLRLTVEDDGRGFNVPDAAGSPGLGLAGMSERANLIGGHLEVTSTPGSGTMVLFTVPLSGEGEAVQ